MEIALQVLCISPLARIVTAAEYFFLTQCGFESHMPCADLTKYQAQRYEAVCGTFGPDDGYGVPWNTGCSLADAFSNSSVSPVALYDLFSVRSRHPRCDGANVTAL